MAKEEKQGEKKKLSTGWIIGIAVIAVIVLIVVSSIGIYNKLVTSEITVDTAWGQVQTVYQRRADLIPNLVNAVQGAVQFEQETQTKIAELRTAATSVKTEIQNAQTPAEMDAAAQKLDGIVSQYRGLNINVENYPELKATANFLALQDELANTENKIAVERQRYNTAVQDFNTKIRVFPSNIIAGMFGFDKRDFFAAAAGAENAPKAEF
ncbi:MAG TPA: LemA family protein [Candidatus Nanoarchaeia archaeon]|nr:LemA family protein [Candidatus Nanoarchaeia archaeon]